MRMSLPQRLLNYAFYIALLAIMFVFSILTPNFLTAQNFIEMMHGFAPVLIMISGLALVVLTGAIDFSVGSIAFLAGSIGTYFMVMQEWPVWICLIIMILSGALFGLVNGLIVEVLKVNPLITTFGTMLAFRGMGYLIAGAKYIPIPSQLGGLHGVKMGPIYVDILVSVILVIFLSFIQKKTVFGRHLMALGCNRENATKLGVKSSSVLVWAFVLSGLFAGIGSIFYIIQGGYMTPRMGQGLEFTGIAIIVIGGISLFGGEGSLLGLLLGIFTVYVIENGLQHLGLSPYVYPFLRGAIIFLAMYADSLKNRIRHVRKIQTVEEGGA